MNSNYYKDDDKKPEYAPLLEQNSDAHMDEFMLKDQDEETGILFQKKKGTRKFRLLPCFLATLVSFVTFIIFSKVYFSPVSLPTDIAQLNTTTSPRILTFNIFMRPPGIKNNKDDYKSERLDYIIQHILPAYDIITFQEAFAFANKRIDKLMLAAYEQGFQYHVASSRRYPWDLGIDGGLLLLSRFPIKKADQIQFARGVHADWLSYKGALHALIEIDAEHDVHVYTTHTQASYDVGGELNLDDTKVRLEQFADVHRFIKDTSQDDTWPVLLMGDLNINAALPPQPNSPDTPSYNSSLAYTMMMDVLAGKGVDLGLIGDKHDETLSYTSSWNLNLTDMPYEKFGYHPVTFGDYKRLSNGTLVPSETVLTNHKQLLSVQSIDRLLWSGNQDRIALQNVSVEPFFVEGQPFTQLSDHYGLSAILSVK